MSDLNRKKAPKQTVLEITRRGSWGQVIYSHKLDCGHIEERKRPAPTPTIACTRCVIAAAKNEELRQIPTQPTRDVIIDVSDIIDLSHSGDLIAEEDAQLIRAALSIKLGVPVDAIDTIMSDDNGTLTLDFVNVFLTARDARRLAQTSHVITMEDTRDT